MTETVLIIDDIEPDPDGGLVRRLDKAGYDRRWLQHLAEVDGYLDDEAPGNPPMAALIDINLHPHKGLDALLRLRKHPATQRTVPILFSNTAVLGAPLKDSYPAGDLHAVFCAYACMEAGILICAKEQELDLLTTSLFEIARRWRNPNLGIQNLIGVQHGDLRMIKPVRDMTSAVRRSLVRSLLGNEMKQDLWNYIVQNITDPQHALHKLLDDYADADWESRPSLTLDSRGGARLWKTIPANLLTQFAGGEIGRVAIAWSGTNQDFLDPTITAYGDLTLPDRPSEGGNAAPSRHVALFASAYAPFLSRWETKEFAAWYFQQPWATTT